LQANRCGALDRPIIGIGGITPALKLKNGRARSTGGPHKKGDITPKVEFFNRQLRQAMSEFAQDSQETEPAI
jgi:hypothetical protein